jgi:hypothetical protein
MIAKVNNNGHGKKAAFLKAYARCGVITRAAVMAKCDRNSHYQWMRVDPEYPARFEQAHKEACDVLVEEARRRAVEGCTKTIYYQGKKCGAMKEFSDTLLIFLMKGAMPETYRERFEHSGSVDHNLTASPEVIAAASVARLELLQERKHLANGSNGNGHSETNGLTG